MNASTDIGPLPFEKWQALGNDYLIVERAQLPFELTPARIRKLCAPHFGVGADGVLLLAPSDDPHLVAQLRIYNPDGSEAELSGNGAREAVLYLHRRGWVEGDVFTIHTAAGAITPTILGPHSCRIDMGAASLTSPSFPSGRSTSRTWMGCWRSTCPRSGPRSKATSSSRSAPTSPGTPKPNPTASGHGSSSAGWGRRSPRAPAPPARP